MEPQSQLQLQLFGTPHITYNGKAVTAFISNKARALLIYLAVTGRSHSRDALSELLWADTPTTKRNNLKTALSNLRKLRGVSLVEERHHLVSLVPGTYWTDVGAFTSLAHNGPQQQIDLLQQAVQLYRDDFLADFNISLSYEFEEWAMLERARLRGQILDLLHRLTDRYVQEDLPNDAIATLRQLLVFEPWEESAHRRLIELLARNDDVGAALRQFEVCRANLREELDVEPSPATLQLVAELRAGSFVVVENQTLHQQKEPIPVVAEKQKKTTVEYPLVGRVRERQVLFERWRKLAGSYFICISGEAGIGKTRLAEELLILAEEEGAVVARARSHELQSQLAYGPITDWLRSAPLWSTVKRLDAAWRTELARLLPELLVDGLTSPEPLKDGWQRKRFFDALLQAFTAVQRPLLLVLDDLQWTDPDTLAWLQYLVEKNASRLLVVGTVRSNEIDGDHPLHRVRQQLQRHHQWTELALAALTEEATHELAALVAEQALAASISSTLFHDTAGNPLFVIESMRVGPMGGGSAPLDSPLHPQWAEHPQPTDDMRTLPIPPKIYNVIQARLAQLSPQAQQIAQLGAAMGRAFDVTLLATAAERDEQSVLLLLDELWQRRIVREVDAIHFDFSHDRIRDVAYAEIRPIRRRVLHRRIVAALEEIHSKSLNAVSRLLAVQCERAGLIEAAVEYSHQAAKLSLQLSANEEAIGILKSSLSLLKTLPNSKSIKQQQLDLMTTLTVPMSTVYGWAADELKELYDEIQSINQQLGGSLSIPLLDGLCRLYRVGGEFERALEIGQGMLQRVEQTAQISHIVQARGAISSSYFWMGHFPTAYDHAKQILNSHNSIEQNAHATEFLNNMSVTSHTYIMVSLYCMGYPQQARAMGIAAITLAHQKGHISTLSSVMAIFCRIPQSLGCPKETLRYAEQTIKLTEEHSVRNWLAVGKVFRGWANAELGDPESGIIEILEGIQGFQKTGVSASTTWFLGLAARVYFEKFNDIATSLSYLDEAFHVAKTTKEELYLAELWRLRGELYLAEGSEDEAERAYEQAIDVARRQQAKSWELRAATNLCYLWQAQGKVAEAYQLLSPLYNWFTEGFDTADLVEAKVLLKELASQTA